MKKLENQKEIIFNTAKDILLHEDINKLSIRMLSTRLNIGMGTIYKYYGNKDEILLDITKDLWFSYIQEVSNFDKSIDSFDEYIEFLFVKLKFFSEKFNYAVLSKELSSSFNKEGKQRHQEAQSIFIDLINKGIKSYYIIEDSKSLIVANFIANNLIALITNKEYSFEIFKTILNDIFTNYKEI